MYCKYCGKEIPENSNFCRYCGGKLLTYYKSKSEEISSRAPDINSDKVEYAGFWVRFGAYMIDLLAIAVILIIIGFLFGDFVHDENPLLDFILSYCAYVIYSTFALSIWSTTFGKYLYGLRVITKDEDNLSFSISFKRSLLQPLSTLFFGIGFWRINDNNKKQAWHDTQADTVVIREKKNSTLAFVLTIIVVIIWVYLYTSDFW
jgi:uncharacterized RDD family membrane protein YckC